VKITEIKVILTCPNDRNFVLVKVCTDEGVYGCGEGTLNGNEPVVAKAIEHMTRLLLGMDPGRIEDIWQFVYHWPYFRGGPVYAAALGAIDLALWDLKGKVAGLPVYELLGGRCRRGAMVYTHAGGRDVREAVDDVRKHLARGSKVVRIQQGPYGGAGTLRVEKPARPGIPPVEIFEPAPYLSTIVGFIEGVRNELGDEVQLCHDVHERLTPVEAARLAKELERLHLFFLEDLLRPEHAESFRLVRRASTTPLAMGELFHSRWQLLPLLTEQLIDYIRIAPLHVGGLTEARKIAAIGETYQVKTAFHGAMDLGVIGQAAAVHLDVAIPNFGVQEWSDFHAFEQICEVLHSPCRLEDGYALPNEIPGLGVDIDEKAAARYPYKPAYMPLVRRQDGSMFVY
jgi:mannonate dehydratase